MKLEKIKYLLLVIIGLIFSIVGIILSTQGAFVLASLSYLLTLGCIIEMELIEIKKLLI